MQYSKEERHLQWQERRCFKYNQEVDTIKEKKNSKIPRDYTHESKDDCSLEEKLWQS